MAEATNWEQTQEKGTTTEKIAESYFTKNGMSWLSVTNDPEFWKIDVDYIVDDELWEVKDNFHSAQYFHKGLFFWIELSVGKNKGWWYKTKANRFFFSSDDGATLIIKHDDKFRKFVNDLIENADHFGDSMNRYDSKPDERGHGVVWAKCMRVYLEQLEDAGFEYRLIRRKHK